MSLTHPNGLANLIISPVNLHHFTLTTLLLFICLNLHHSNVQTSPTPYNSQENPLNQYLREPEIVKVYKEKIVLRLYPLTKKDVKVSDYYLIVEQIEDRSKNQSMLGIAGSKIENVDFSLNYYNSVRKRLNYFAAVHIFGDLFYRSTRRFVTLIIGQHQIDLSKPREFHADAYVNPLLNCGKQYRIGVAALLDRSKSSKKEFIYVPSSRTIIMNENGSCESTDTYELFFILSLIALVVSLVSLCLILTYNTITTGNLIFWKRKKMNCQQLLKDDLGKKEILTLINHTNIYEGEYDRSDYDEMSIKGSKIKNFNLVSKSNHS